jgi:hypothetical protein
MEEENMSRKIIRKFAAAMFALGSVGVTTSAGPAKAAFVSADLVNLSDVNGVSYRPVATGACYNYFQDINNQQWQLLSQVYYFSSDMTGTTVPIVFAILVNTTTGTVTDGGYRNTSVYRTYYNRTVPACSSPPF